MVDVETAAVVGVDIALVSVTVTVIGAKEEPPVESASVTTEVMRITEPGLEEPVVVT